MPPRPARIHKEYRLPFADMSVDGDLREVQQADGYGSTCRNPRDDLEHGRRIMGRTEAAQ
jgi:taurine transport system ATP-binding protein